MTTPYICPPCEAGDHGHCSAPGVCQCTVTDWETPCFPVSEDGHNCTLTEGHDGPHICCDGHEWVSSPRPRPDCPDPTGELAKTQGDCSGRPCWCGIAIVMGCTCGFYLDPIVRRAGHHSTECGIFEKQTPV